MKIKDTVLYVAEFPITRIRTVRFRIPKKVDDKIDFFDLRSMFSDAINNYSSVYDYDDDEEWENLDRLEIDSCTDTESECIKSATKLFLMPDKSEIYPSFILREIKRFDEKK